MTHNKHIELTDEGLLECFDVRPPGCTKEGTVFIIGSADSLRITVHSQQLRAIKLAEALCDTKRVKPGDRVGIVGGGVAGTTAAVVLAERGVHVELFERNSEVLEVFAGASHRILHPYIYDWPHKIWRHDDAGFPCMSWTADKASCVAKQLRLEFSARKRLYKDLLKVRLNMKHLGWSIDDPLAIRDGRSYRYAFKHLVIALGPGKERLFRGAASYWNVDDLSIPQLNEGTTYVIGAGDGGLIDTMRVRLKGFDEEAIIQEFFSSWCPSERRQVESQIYDFESSIRTSESVEQIERHYSKFAEEATSAVSWITSRLRDDTKIVLIDRLRSPYTSRAAPLNRFLFSCLMLADSADRFRYIGGTLDDSQLPKNVVAFTDRIESFTLGSTDRLVCRLGPESALEQFSPALYRLAAEKLRPISSLDLFRSSANPHWLNVLGKLPRARSDWDEEEFPLSEMLTTRYVRFDVGGKYVHEHSQRGSNFDIGNSYLQRRPLSVVEAIRFNERVLLIGPVGVGKSRIVKRLYDECMIAYHKSVSTTLIANRPEWLHSSLAAPKPLRISAYAFATWLSGRRRVRAPLFTYVSYVADCLGSFGPRDLLKSCKKCGVFLIIEDWSDVPQYANPEVATRQEVAATLSDAIDELTAGGVPNAIVILTNSEPVCGSDDPGYQHELKLFSRFERFVIAPLSSEHVSRLVNAFRTAKGCTADFPGLLSRAQQDHFDSIVKTPAGLRQLLELWWGLGQKMYPNLSVEMLIWRSLEEYFDATLALGNDEADEESQIVFRLREVLTRRFCEDPAMSPITFAESDLPKCQYGFRRLLHKGLLTRHSTGRYGIARIPIQDMLVGWGLLCGELPDSFDAKQSGHVETSLLRILKHVGNRRIEPLRYLIDMAFGGGSLPTRPSELLDGLIQRENNELNAIAVSHVAGLASASRFVTMEQRKHWRDVLLNGLVIERRQHSLGEDLQLQLTRVARPGSARQRRAMKNQKHSTANVRDRSLTPHERYFLGRTIAILENYDKSDATNCLLPDIHWISVNPGVLRCGATEADVNLYSDRRAIPPDDEPPCDVSFGAFEIAKYCITIGQFRLFVEDAAAYSNEDNWEGLVRPQAHMCSCEIADMNYPITSVTWDEAKAFTRWLSAVTGDEIDLPTSYEWEFAARSGRIGENRVFTTGNSLDYGTANCQEEGLPGPCAVGLFPESDSPLGISDLCGNVFEWCDDAYSQIEADFKITKGGSYNHDRLRCRLAVRGKKHRSSQHPYIGFRVIRRHPAK